VIGAVPRGVLDSPSIATAVRGIPELTEHPGAEDDAGPGRLPRISSVRALLKCLLRVTCKLSIWAGRLVNTPTIAATLAPQASASSAGAANCAAG
jgi:hypothetical protein